jgi:hypothetical protein
MTTADNQQERLRLQGWIQGFADGEGCFSISIFKNATTRSGYQVFPEFVVTQGEKSKETLVVFQKFFNCGNVYVNRRHDNHKENIYRYCVRSIVDLQKCIIPFFLRNLLRSAKARDFTLFVQAVDLIAHEQHLNPSGFKKLARIKSQMNRKILRDYTSDPPMGGKI